MNEQVSRQDAIDQLARAQFAALSVSDKESCLLGEGSDENSDREGGDNKSMTDEETVILAALRRKYIGVTNSYLTRELSQLVGHSIEVAGEREPMFACPCCEYLTLRERGEYQICPVCRWEDTGVDEHSAYSGPNHMTLGEGRENFKKFGAVSERASALVERAPDKYERIVFHAIGRAE